MNYRMSSLLLAVVTTLLMAVALQAQAPKGEVVIDFYPVGNHPQPSITNMVKPVYPSSAMEDWIYSRVVVRITNGHFRVVSMKDGAHEYGFDAAALKAVAKWKFTTLGVVDAEFRFR